jgi:hypothetical protein
MDPLHLDVAGHLVSLPGVLALGALVGYVAGLFGAGGGFLLTPLLVVVFDVPVPLAVGSGLCQMTGTATAAYLRHRRHGSGEARIGVLMGAGSLLGVDAGARLLATLTAAGAVTVAGREVSLVWLVIQSSFTALLLVVAIAYLVSRTPERELLGHARPGPLARWSFGPRATLPSVPELRPSGAIVAQLGLGLGFVSGLLGIGGGIILTPLLTAGLGLTMRQAAGTGLSVLLISAFAGTAKHALAGNVDLPLTVALLVTSSLSAQIGARATRRIAPGRLRRGFALVILAAAAAVVWHVLAKLFG